MRADDIDIHIGKKLNYRRVILKVTQSHLASQLGIRAQQIQKYEKATNRIPAARLWRIAKILDVPLNYFYPDDIEQIEDDVKLVLPATKEGFEILKAYFSIKNTKLKKSIFNLVCSVKEGT